MALTLREGNYTFEAECGPEYYTRVGHFSVNRFGADHKTLAMKRIVDMASEGWWSGDLHVHRRPADLELLMRADDVHVAEVMTWSNKKNDLARPGTRPERFPGASPIRTRDDRQDSSLSPLLRAFFARRAPRCSLQTSV